MAPAAADDWRAADLAEAYGYTWGSSRHGDEPWKQIHAVDLVRASSRGKPFWHAEAYAGPLWLAQNVLNKPRDEGRIAAPEDIRYWDMTSFMCGATGLLYLRWRPLLDGPLFGAFGGYGMDGSRTPRSEMVSKVGKWTAAPEQEKLWQSRPIKGEIGIVYVPETQIFDYSQQGNTDFYAKSMQGAYQGFFDNNIQADWVHIDDIDERSLLYLPFPVMLNEETAEKLRDWVAAGGTLISEGCPAYFGDRGHVGQVQPNYGLDELFGARESYVEFVPDLLDDEQLNFSGTPVWGGIYLQAYEPTTGTADRLVCRRPRCRRGQPVRQGAHAAHRHHGRLRTWSPCTRRLGALLQGSAGLRRPGTTRGLQRSAGQGPRPRRRRRRLSLGGQSDAPGAACSSPTRISMGSVLVRQHAVGSGRRCARTDRHAHLSGAGCDRHRAGVVQIDSVGSQGIESHRFCSTTFTS